jgi:hypothetical protein
VNKDELQEKSVAYRTGNYQSLDVSMAEELYRQEVLDARRMSPEDKLILGERLFRWACAITLAGIRFQNPEAAEEDCQRLLRERIELGKKMGTL